MITPSLLPLPSDFDQCRQAFSTRRVRREAAAGLLAGALRPAPGDLVLARVTELGQHRNVELLSGRKASLFPGDLLMLAYGNRYAPDQFEARVPLDLGPCDLIAGGGLASREVARHAAMSRPTQIRPLGLLADAEGRRLNLRDTALPPAAGALDATVPVYVVCGSSMNAGKTYAAAMLIRGLRARGRRVAAFKATGTGSGNDLWKMHDAGACSVLDFVDAGFPSTYGVALPELERAFDSLLQASLATGADAVVVEIADGLGQAETAGLLRSDTLRRSAHGLLFAAPDPFAAVAGERWLREAGLPLFAISGVVSAESEVLAEAAALVQVPVLSAARLADGLNWPAPLVAAAA